MTADSKDTDTRLPAFDSSTQEVYLQLWRCYDRLKAIEDEVFGRYDLSAQQYNALRLLDASYPAGTPTIELGRRLISRMPDMTRMLNRLEERGLVNKRRLPDNRRVVEAAITPDGRRLLKDMSGEVQEMHARQLGHLEPEQQQQLIQLLKAARKPHEDDNCDWLEN